MKTFSRLFIFLGVASFLIGACSPTAATATAPAVVAPADTAAPKATASPATSTSNVLSTSFKSDWFAVYERVLANWVVTPDPADVNKFTIKPKQPTGTAKNIFVLYPRKSSAYDTAISTILDVLASRKLNVNFTIVNFDRKEDKGKAALALAESLKPDLIYTMGSESTDFAVLNFKGKTIPVVSVCSKDPVLLGYMKDYNTGSKTNFAFTSLDVPIAVQVNYLKQIKPNLKNIAVMYADSNASAKATQVKPLKDVALENGFRVLDVVALQDATAKKELEASMPIVIEEMKKTDANLQNSIFWITGSTPVFNEIATINQMAGKVPVLSVVPDVVKEGDNSAVLSIGVSFESNAYLGALYGIEILSGTNPGEMKVGVVSPPDISINFKRAKAIDLKLPFSFFESSSFVYNYDGKTVRKGGEEVRAP